MEKEISESVELMSFHSCSKGLLGECGVRGGYVEFHNFEPEVVAQYNKLRCISICSNSIGQILMDLKCRPPKLGVESDESVLGYEEDVNGLLESLTRRA